MAAQGNSLDRDIFDLETPRAHDLINKDFDTSDSITYDGNFSNANTAAKLTTSTTISSNDEGLTAFVKTSADLKFKNQWGHTYNFRLRPIKLMAYADLGHFSISQSNWKLSANPYAFYANNRNFSRSIFGLGNIFTLSENLKAHVS